jgi:lysophospholipase L1-like esterase
VIGACGGSASSVTSPDPTTTTTTAGETITVPASAPAAYVIGDSLTVGVQPYLRRAFAARGVRLAGVDGRVFRTTAEGLRILRAKANRLPDTVVLALGTNDLLATQADVKSWLRQARSFVGDRRRLIWINVYVDLTRQPKLKRYRVINDALDYLAPQYDIEVADWNRWVERHEVPQQRDGVHYTEKGYRIRAAFYARVVAGRAES